MAKINSKTLTKYLRQIAEEAADTIRDDGSSMTNAEKLARVIWRKACGYTEMRELKDGQQQEVIHKPDNTAIMLIVERLDGKVPTAEPETTDRLTVEDAIDDLAKKRLNAFVKSTVSVPPPLTGKRGGG